MIVHVSGNILDSDAAALVNPVNTVGVMGKGLAKQFKAAYPQVNLAYIEACRTGVLHIGAVQACEVAAGKWVVNVPTKQHWRLPSKIEYIQQGLQALVRWLDTTKVHSVAMPLLGCGLGGLRKEEVLPLIETTFALLPHVGVQVYTLEVSV